MLKAVDIRPLWQDIYPGILSIWREMPWRDWIPEDIYAACLTGSAALLVGEGIPPSEGFMVCRMDQNENGKNLFIWIAWCPTDDGAATIYKELDEIAETNGCTAIEFVTGEPKLVEFAKNFGYDNVMYEVRKKITPIEQPPEE
jgi:hypothetical protein